MISIDELLAADKEEKEGVFIQEEIDSEKEPWLKEALSKKTIEELDEIGRFVYRLFCDDGYSYRTFQDFSFNRIEKKFRCRWIVPIDRFPFGDAWMLENKSEFMCFLTKEEEESREKQFELIKQFLMEDRVHEHNMDNVGIIWGNCQKCLSFTLRKV